MNIHTPIAAAALLLAAAPALAQTAPSPTSNVSVYGIIDIAVSKADTGQSNLAHFSDWQIGTRGAWTMHSSSSARLGMKGSEVLDGDLRANFLIEHRFQPDTGSTEPRDGVTYTGGVRSYNAGFWNSQAWVGLSSSRWGELRLGRTATPHFNVGIASDPWGYEYNVASFAGYTRGGNFVAAQRNSALYLSPKFRGLSVQLGVGLGEGGTSATATGSPNGRNVGAALQYNEGPLWLALAWNDSHRSDAINNRSTMLAGSLDLGWIKPMANLSFGQNNVAGNPTTTTWLLGAHMPAGTGTVRLAVGRYDPAKGFNPNAVTPGATVATTPNPYAAFPVTNGQATAKLGLGYVHPLSKRTSLSADVGIAKTETYSRSLGVQTGLKHVF